MSESIPTTDQQRCPHGRTERQYCEACSVMVPTANTDDLLSSVATSIDAEIYRQYQAGADWEEAKDVLECLDYCNVASVAMAAINAWEKRQVSKTDTAPSDPAPTVCSPAPNSDHTTKQTQRALP